MNSMEDILELKCIMKNIDIKLCARIESGVKQLIALVTREEDLILHYTFGELCPVLKRIPWFTDCNKTIQAICFDPTATWLLIVSLDSSLSIVPALNLVDKKQKIDCKWSLDDLTQFHRPPQLTDSKPTCAVWWQTLDCNQNALVGYDNGTIALISLTDGRCLACCSISEAVTNLYLCQDNSLDAVSLLINGESGQQWKHTLEQHSSGYIWPTETNHQAEDSSRSRLYNLKQMGADKLASLKQIIAEARGARRDSFTSDTTSASDSSHTDSIHSCPELLHHLPDTYFAPQHALDRYLFTAFYKPSSLLTVHTVDVESAPLYSHKLPPNTDALLLTDKLIFTVNSERNVISIVSSQLSECSLQGGESEFHTEALLAQFTLEKEKILNVYKLSDFSIRPRRSKNDKKDKSFEFPKSVENFHIRQPKLDTCVIVTGAAIYKISISMSPIKKFTACITEENNFEKAERVAQIFGLGIHHLLECCGDLMIGKGSFHSGIILYKQAKVPLLKRVLKLAISADCKTLLKFVHLCLSSSKGDMSIATKIHIGNFAVMAYTELILRHGGALRMTNTRDFMNFLRQEEFYDQILAVNVACQAGQWNIVALLAKSRGLHLEVVTALGQILQSARAPRTSDKEFLFALSEPSLTQSLLLLPQSSQIILHYIRTNIELFPIDILQRLAVQLDPSQPCAIPLTSRMFYNNKFSSSLDTSDSMDMENLDQEAVNLKDFIETFTMVLIYLINRKNSLKYSLQFLEKSNLSFVEATEKCTKRLPPVRTLSCGYEHAAVVRNGAVYTMGMSSSGCLGLGPLLAQSSPPKLVQTLSDLKVKAISVSCGRRHTLVLTDFGVYAWGSNNFGQIGLGALIQESPHPQIVSGLIHAKVIDVVAGQYHSMALTATGKVYTWGWGLHGQLGHSNCDNEYLPKLLDFEEPVSQIAAGHAHSLILTNKGKLYGFGSNVFGQLESCQIEASKVCAPVWIPLTPDVYQPIDKIASSYFHNVAVRADQEVFVWGASPQEVRIMQAKSNKKQNGVALQGNESWKANVHVYSGDDKQPIEQVAIGYNHLAILHASKIVWGKNKDDCLNPIKLREQDNLGILSQRFLHVACGWDYTIAIDHAGKVLAWGSPSMAQTILGKSLDDERKMDGKIMVLKNTKRVIQFPNNAQGNAHAYPIEVPGLPTMAITFSPTDHRLIFAKKTTPYAIRKIENSNQTQEEDMQPPRRNVSPLSAIHAVPEVIFSEKTLHYVLETYSGLYDSEIIIQKCLNAQNYQAASKVAMLDGHFCDSLNFQLLGFKKFMDSIELNLEALHKENVYNTSKNYIIDEKCVPQSNSLEKMSCGSSPAHALSSSSSLDSIRLWEDQEHQGGCESPCESNDIGDIRLSITQYVEAVKHIELSPPISSISQLVSRTENEFNESKTTGEELNVKLDRNTIEIVNGISKIVEFYIEKIYVSENHILMQNILLKCIEFWLSNSLPVSILEKVLLKNMDKYFYPLSILLFCKNFSNNIENDVIEKDCKYQHNSASFLKEFSTKFCLQLCSMVLENVNKS